MLFEAVLRAGRQLIEVPSGPGHPDHRYLEVAAFHHRLQSRKDLLVCEVAGGAEEG
jgi:hypothetical protein